MDTVYGTKKYFQSLSGASDIYRSPTCRAVSNDYTYQNTLGRRSTLGAYYHMNKQPAYTNDHSVNSQYSYNAWGMWRDGRNIAPSTFSTKTHAHYQKPRSFSTILTTAVFIVLLAVISIAGLAFYFSSVKANLEDPVLGFEGSFRIAKGDLFSTGLKYNHTTTYKQKIDFYKRFVERALMDNGLQSLRVDVWGFGEGPLIKVSFRTFLDVRKLPQNIHSVEEYIKESLYLETTAAKSLYRSLRIDPESVEIKRILDEQVVRSASLFKEQTAPTSQTQLEKRLLKKPVVNTPPSPYAKSTTTVKPRTTPARPHSVDDEPDVDVENAPVIQGSFEGSFEITKTDADISRKKVAPTKAYTSLAPKAVTPYSLRVKPKKPSIEKLTTIIPHQQPTTTVSMRSSSRSTSTTSTTTTSTTSSSTTSSTSTSTTSTTARPPTTSTSTSTSAPSTTINTTKRTNMPTLPASTIISFSPSTSQPVYPYPHFGFPPISTPSTSLTVPKLDPNLFTSVPVLDTQPWKPIHREVPELLPGLPPAIPTKTLVGLSKPLPSPTPPVPFMPQDIPQRRIDEIELPFIPENPSPPTPPAYNPYAPGFFGTAVRKPDLSKEVQTPQDMLFYHSFGNPVYMPGTDDIERLGAGAHVQPHPLPVPLIGEVVVPPFKRLVPEVDADKQVAGGLATGGSNERFEHLGGGVIVKKNEENKMSAEEITDKPVVKAETTTKSIIMKTAVSEKVSITTLRPKSSTPNINRIESSANSELADTIGEFFMGLLNLPKEEARNATTTTTTTTTTSTTTTEEPIESRNEPEELDGTQYSTKVAGSEEGFLGTTTKPTFLNLKELILKRNQVKNQTRNMESSTIRTRTTGTTLMPSTPTTTMWPTMGSSTTKRNRIRPTYNQKPPTILDDSNLFPSHSKWEFMNNTASNNFGHTGNMRKVFNKTLQAWISEDVGNNEENFTLNDIKTRINNATNIQDISLIFDTLASKLGITPVVPTKVPPYSQNKLKYPARNETRTKTPNPTMSSASAEVAAYTTPSSRTRTTVKVMRTTGAAPTVRTTIRKTTTTMATTTTTPLPPTTTTTVMQQPQYFTELPQHQREPFIRPMASFMEDTSSEGIGAAIPVVGEAEVEVIDPNKYEEMLKSSQFAAETTTETLPRLVTLMPVRSNSGIRTYRPTLEETARGNSGTSAEATGGTEEVGATSTAEVQLEAAPTATAEPSVTAASRMPVTNGVESTVNGSQLRRKGVLGQGRRFPPAETIVKGGLKVTVK